MRYALRIIILQYTTNMFCFLYVYYYFPLLFLYDSCFAASSFVGNTKRGVNNLDDHARWWNAVNYDFNLSKQQSYGGISAAALLDQQKLYVSVAVISSRISSISTVVRSILGGLLIPTHIFIFLSEDPYLLDKGIPRTAVPLELQYLQASTNILSIVYTENIGPHRKLLPVLRKFWDEDCVIVTFDDDRPVPKTALFRLVNHYLESNKEAVVGLRVRRIGLDFEQSDLAVAEEAAATAAAMHSTLGTSTTAGKTQHRRADTSPRNSSTQQYYFRVADYGVCAWPRVQNSRVEMLVLPTGNGGILYRPRFFHPIVFDRGLREVTMYNDDLTFRLGTLVNHVPVVNGCCDRGVDHDDNRCVNKWPLLRMDTAGADDVGAVVGITKRNKKAGGEAEEVLPRPQEHHGDRRRKLYNRASNNSSLSEGGKSKSKRMQRLRVLHSSSVEDATDANRRRASSLLNNVVDKSAAGRDEEEGGGGGSTEKTNKKKNKSTTTTAKTTTAVAAPGGSGLWSKNQYWNTKMWMTGLAYLKQRGLLDMQDYLDWSFVAQERPECFPAASALSKETKERKEMKEGPMSPLARASAPTATTSIAVNNSANIANVNVNNEKGATKRSAAIDTTTATAATSAGGLTRKTITMLQTRTTSRRKLSCERISSYANTTTTTTTNNIRTTRAGDGCRGVTDSSPPSGSMASRSTPPRTLSNADTGTTTRTSSSTSNTARSPRTDVSIKQQHQQHVGVFSDSTTTAKRRGGGGHKGSRGRSSRSRSRGDKGEEQGDSGGGGGDEGVVLESSGDFMPHQCGLHVLNSKQQQQNKTDKTRRIKRTRKLPDRQSMNF